jgi:hypothetical protein
MGGSVRRDGIGIAAAARAIPQALCPPCEAGTVSDPASHSGARIAADLDDGLIVGLVVRHRARAGDLCRSSGQAQGGTRGQWSMDSIQCSDWNRYT